ncbi:hypothetical protein V6N12_072119 [Hibiscus sabdariffa]|uniref:Mitochondrial carrier protein n=1 Tax=Hibiscus sabdariffa TaxID=183260 RepID=A0ABR2FMB2_9ROSI
MYLVVIEEKDRLVNLPGSHLDVLRPLILPFVQKSFAFCIPRDRWDKEFFRLQARRQVSYVDRLPVYAKELIAGGASGAFAKTTVAPLERTKILLQTRTDGFRSLGVYQSLRKVLNHEGVLGFYKGNGASVIRIIPYAALHFMTYEQYRGWILHNYPFMGSGPFVDLLAGSASGGTAVLCTYPLDLARTKLAYQVTDTGTNCRSGVRSLYPQPAYSGVRDVVTSVYKEAGIRGLYRGVGPTLVGILPYAGLKFYVYEVLKTHVPEEQRKSIVMHLSCGAVAGLLGQTFTYPLDVVRRQMQVENLQCSTTQGGVTRYRNTLDGLTTIVRYQGWRQLFAGLSINYMKMVPSVAVGFAGYDMMKKMYVGTAVIASSTCSDSPECGLLQVKLLCVNPSFAQDFAVLDLGVKYTSLRAHYKLDKKFSCFWTACSHLLRRFESVGDFNINGSFPFFAFISM